MNSDHPQRIRTPNVIDLVHLARQSGGDAALEHELLGLFADQCVRHLDTIRTAGARQGADAAHTLKGAARAIGAWDVAAAAEKVEQSLGNGQAAGRDAGHLGELTAAAAEARDAIAAITLAA